PGWKGALVVDRFYEYNPGDNTPPRVRTVAWLTYDAKALYVAFRCDDPDPSKIRAPFVERDNVIGNQDNVAVMIDARNDRRAALQLRANPRGIQADAVNAEASGAEDFSPDFFYDTAAKITATGWQVEFRIPLATLRYPKSDPQSWGILLIRNYPREFRYQIASSPIPRGSNCFLCHMTSLTGITGLPAGGNLVAAPYVSAKEDGSRADPFDPASPFENGSVKPDAGLDVKWTPSANIAVDGTLNPDFSQIESDVAQIAVNSRFAIFYPENRPFFLESVDLLQTPIQAVYTRTITSPSWGVRGTGQLGGTTFTALLAHDRGGGTVVIPGPTESSYAPQDFSSFVAIGRARQSLGGSEAGLLITDRENSDGSFNRVLGPDAQWVPNDKDRLTGQFLYSDTRVPDQPDLSPDWDGRRFSSRAFLGKWDRTTRTYDVTAAYADTGAGFRADDGFVFQVGVRETYLESGARFYPKGFLSFVRPYVVFDYVSEPDGSIVSRSVIPGVALQGRWNLQVNLMPHLRDKVRTGDVVFDQTFLRFNALVQPGRVVPQLTVTGQVGQSVDVVNVRLGNGGSLTAGATMRPFDRLELEANSQFEWLNVTAESGERGRLFTALAEYLKVTFHFSAHAYLRLIGQYLETNRNPALYTVPVPERTGGLSGSALFAYRLNWQTVFFLGYGDNRVLTERNDLVLSDRQFFLKLSYAFRL
ncbi:MAG TPA: DUF5916 domain-containing protein, partial [Thermoanaerobaculia bacterium]|nr:DUF5916 domain-containing protein [Thermoanaerobaculia bacterium]